MKGEDTDRIQFADRVVRELGPNPLRYVDLSIAYQLPKAWHRNQNRKSGERYFTHPRAVAEILLDFGPSSYDEVITALLHDALEDAFIVPEALARLFGERVAQAVVALTKYSVVLEDQHITITKTKLTDELYFARLHLAEHFTRRVKLGDRLHNLRTMWGMGLEHWARQIKETRQYVLPLAATSSKNLALALEVECRKWEQRFPSVVS